MKRPDPSPGLDLLQPAAYGSEPFSALSVGDWFTVDEGHNMLGVKVTDFLAFAPNERMALHPPPTALVRRVEIHPIQFDIPPVKETK